MFSETRGRGSSAEATPPEKMKVVASKKKMLEVVNLLDLCGIIGQPRAMLRTFLKSDSESGRDDKIMRVCFDKCV